MTVTITLKKSSVANKRPLASSLVPGELALNANTLSTGLFFLDCASNVVKVGPAAVGPSAPNITAVGSPGNSVGETWYDTTNSALFVWDGFAWRASGGGLPSTPTAAGVVFGCTTVNNSALGCNALASLTTGLYNTAVGAFALCSNTTGCGNVMAGGLTSAGLYEPIFNPVTESDRVIVGSTSTTNAYVQVSWSSVSDARDKIVCGTVPHGLNFVNQLEPKTYRFTKTRESGVPHGPQRYGFLAQDILALEGGQGIIIDAEDDEKLRYNGEALVPVLVNAIKELSAEVEKLKAQLPGA